MYLNLCKSGEGVTFAAAVAFMRRITPLRW